MDIECFISYNLTLNDTFFLQVPATTCIYFRQGFRYRISLGAKPSSLHNRIFHSCNSVKSVSLILNTEVRLNGNTTLR